MKYRSTWVIQSVKCPTLDFGSGHALTVCEIEPRVRLHADSVEPAWDSLSPPFFVPLLLARLLSLSNFKKWKPLFKKTKYTSLELLQVESVQKVLFLYNNSLHEFNWLEWWFQFQFCHVALVFPGNIWNIRFRNFLFWLRSPQRLNLI